MVRPPNTSEPHFFWTQGRVWRRKASPNPPSWFWRKLRPCQIELKKFHSRITSWCNLNFFFNLYLCEGINFASHNFLKEIGIKASILTLYFDKFENMCILIPNCKEQFHYQPYFEVSTIIIIITMRAMTKVVIRQIFFLRALF